MFRLFAFSAYFDNASLTKNALTNSKKSIHPPPLAPPPTHKFIILDNLLELNEKRIARRNSEIYN